MVNYLGGTVVPRACAPDVWKNVAVRAMKTGARMRISIPKGPSDLMNLPFSCFSPLSHKWVEPHMQRVVSNIWSTTITKAVFLRFSSHLLEWGWWGWRSCQSLGLFVMFLRCSWFVIMDGLNQSSVSMKGPSIVMWGCISFDTIFRWVVSQTSICVQQCQYSADLWI